MTVSSVTNFIPADSSPAPQAPKDSGSGDLFSDMLRSQMIPPAPAPAANQPPPPSDSAHGIDSANDSASTRADDDRANANSSTQNDSPPSNPANANESESSTSQTAKNTDNSQANQSAADSAKGKTDKTDKTDAKTGAKKTGKDDEAKNDAQSQGNAQAATPALTAIVGVAPPATDAPNTSGPAKGGDASAAQTAAVTPATGLTAQASANADAQASALTPVAPTAAGASNSSNSSKDTNDQNTSQDGKSKAGDGFGQLTADVTVVDPSKTLVSKPPATRAPVRNDDATASNSQQDSNGLNVAPGDGSAAADKTVGDGKTPSDGTPVIHVDSLQQLAGDAGSQPQKPTSDASQANQTSNQQQTVTNTVLAPGTIVHGPDFRTDASTLALLHGAQSNAIAPSSVANLDQVAVQITKAATDGLDKINIQLKPESLGRIDVQLQVAHNGQVNAVIAADRQDTLDLLRRDAGSLQQALNNAGLRADSGSLSFNLSNQGQNNLPQSFSNSASANVPSTVSPDLPAVSPAAIAYSAAAARGGVDIQV